MALGPNTVNTFSDSLDDIRAAARDFREYANKMGQLVDTTRLENNTGLSWKEVVLQKLQAQGIDDLTDLEQNPQEILDSLFTVTPTMVGMSVFMSDRVKIRINAKVAAKIGVLTENAMARKVDVDLIAVAQAATTDVGTAGNPHSSDIVSTSVARIQSNTTEPWDGPIVHVAKGFQIKDIQDEGVAGWGTYPTQGGGITESFLRNGYSGPLFGADVHKDDNISVDSADDAISVTFASGPNSAIVMVTGAESRRVTDRKEGIGGGAEIMYATDEYGTGIRQQAWLMAGTSDSAVPTV